MPSKPKASQFPTWEWMISFSLLGVQSTIEGSWYERMEQTKTWDCNWYSNPGRNYHECRNLQPVVQPRLPTPFKPRLVYQCWTMTVSVFNARLFLPSGQ